jgi:putative transposase
VLNHFLVFGERHLRYILKCWLQYYHQFRPHQGLGNVLLAERGMPSPELSDVVPLGEIVCHESLGGLLKHYERKAA